MGTTRCSEDTQVRTSPRSMIQLSVAEEQIERWRVSVDPRISPEGYPDCLDRVQVRFSEAMMLPLVRDAGLHVSAL